MHRFIRVSLFTLVFLAGTAQADDSLVARWSFDDGKGGTLYDNSGHDHHGVIHGAKWVKVGVFEPLEWMDGKQWTVMAKLDDWNNSTIVE